MDHSDGARTFSGKSSVLYHDALILHVQVLIRSSHNRLSFFKHLLPSIVNTVDCGFRYEVILDYDRGDAFYDTPQGREVTLRWFQVYIHIKLLDNCFPSTKNFLFSLYANQNRHTCKAP